MNVAGCHSYFGILLLAGLFLPAIRTAGQPIAGRILPTVILSGDSGGLLDGSPWDSGSLRGKPALIALLDPDEKHLLDPFVRALDNGRGLPSGTTGIAILDCRQSWLPDTWIRAAAWWDRAVDKVGQARNQGVVQALLVKRTGHAGHWMTALDESGVVRRSWQLPDGALHLFLVNAEGMVILQHKGILTSRQAAAWLELLSQMRNG